MVLYHTGSIKFNQFLVTLGVSTESENLYQKGEFVVNSLRPGEGEKVSKGSKVKVHYTGKLENGTVFDCSVSRGQPIQFTVGMGQVIKGWDIGICQMKKGQKAMITCPPDYGYGA